VNSFTQYPGEVDQLVHLLARSIELRHENRLREALACINLVLEMAPSFTPCLPNRAEVLALLGRYDEALADCERHLADAGPLAGTIALRDSIRDQALAHFEERRRLNPRDIESLYEQGNIYLRTGEFALAERDYAMLLHRKPGHLGALANRGYVLVALNRLEDALASYKHLLRLDANMPAHSVNCGNVLKSLGRLNEAEAAYRHAIRLQHDFAEGHIELAHCHLAAGEYELGWRGYEWRWKSAQMQPHYLRSPELAWLGQFPVRGKTVLVWAEQGYGDMLQFARFLPLLADRAGKVILRVPAALRELLQTVDTRIEVIAGPSGAGGYGAAWPLPPHDYHCPMLSLPLALGLAGPPSGAPYLRAPDDRVMRWATALTPHSRPRIGLAWAGKRRGPASAGRDVPLCGLAVLATLDADFVCLQRDICTEDAETLEQFPHWVCPGPALADFSDTAALVAQLDLVITADTSVAHLAGALGKPCWLMLRQSGEWRWQLQRQDTPWYGSMRLIRQRREGCWDEVFRDILALGARFVAAWMPSDGSAMLEPGHHGAVHPHEQDSAPVNAAQCGLDYRCLRGGPVEEEAQLA
jgi:tetratricopeptide (TPR) repeat protein